MRGGRGGGGGGGGEPPSWAREAAVDVAVDVAAALEAAGGDTVAGRAPGRDAGGGDGLRTSASSEEADAATRSESMPPTMSSADPDMVTGRKGPPYCGWRYVLLVEQICGS